MVATADRSGRPTSRICPLAVAEGAGWPDRHAIAIASSVGTLPIFLVKIRGQSPKFPKFLRAQIIASDPYTAETGTADARRSTPMEPTNIRVHRRASAVSNCQLCLLHSSVYRHLTGL